MSEKAKEILRMDLYALLGVESTATPKQIKKAYRQKALACHPDKNPDNPKAADLFHQLSQALELLIDAAARAAYDKACAAKRQAEERNRKLDDKRKKFKFDLEAREHEYKRQEEEKITRDQEEREITRLREEGCRLLEEEQQRYRDREKEAQRLATAGSTQTAGRCSKSNVTPKLKLKWKCRKDDDTNGGYSQDVLFRLLYKYGDILNVLVSSKKKGSAVVEFATVQGAERAVKYETGLNGNPLKISWIEGEPEVASTQGPLGSERDFESLVLMRMRQAAERQKLIEEMQKEDEEEGGAKS